jgi:hypothetical protein
MPSDASYRGQLGIVLRQQSVPALRNFLRAAAERSGDERQVAEIDARTDDDLEALLHRMTVARPDLSDLHRHSREWLFKHGIDPYGEADGRQN